MGKAETSDRESVILKRKLISNSWCDLDLFFKDNHGKLLQKYFGMEELYIIIFLLKIMELCE